jgi:hypothetical protein
MDDIKSLEYNKVFTALLCDVQTLHSNVFTSSALRKTLLKVERRYSSEGIGFLTKTLPRLGKYFDKVLAGQFLFDSIETGFKPCPNSKLPRFLGELFSQVLSLDGAVLQNADVVCVKSIRQLCYLFYKLELPFDPELEQSVIDKFVKTEYDIKSTSELFASIAENFETHRLNSFSSIKPDWASRAIRKARINLQRLFRNFDHTDIYPKHGPGVVSTKETLWRKYAWTQISSRITDVYPLDSYFYASIGHVCDSFKEFNSLTDGESSARVLLVPKDSRGPRLISCEPLDFQWIQQGLGRAIVDHVERHPLTKESVRFTDQQPNRIAAKYGSVNGKYSTIDLNEASDRVTVGLVRLLFPEPVLTALLACRSLGTKLPDGTYITLNKYAPMGSALCFPVLSLTVWALLVSALPIFDADFNDNEVYVYGDDVIVPTNLAEHAMIILELFGLKVNRDKSCTKGLFRESCGLDAFRGTEVTPVRFRTPWSSHRSPDVYTSWISYANSMYINGYSNCGEYISVWLCSIYGAIPEKACGLTAPSLIRVPESGKTPRARGNPNLQRLEYLVLTVVPCSVNKEIDGWSMLLRFFSEGCSVSNSYRTCSEPSNGSMAPKEPFSVRTYTYRKRVKLRYRWL